MLYYLGYVWLWCVIFWRCFVLAGFRKVCSKKSKMADFPTVLKCVKCMGCRWSSHAQTLWLSRCFQRNVNKRSCELLCNWLVCYPFSWGLSGMSGLVVAVVSRICGRGCCAHCWNSTVSVICACWFYRQYEKRKRWWYFFTNLQWQMMWQTGSCCFHWMVSGSERWSRQA